MPICPLCKSPALERNGKTPKGKQKWHCGTCGKCHVEGNEHVYTEAQKEQIIHAHIERMSLRAIERTFGVCRYIVSQWIKKSPRIERFCDHFETG